MPEPINPRAVAVRPSRKPYAHLEAVAALMTTAAAGETIHITTPSRAQAEALYEEACRALRDRGDTDA